TPEDSEDDDNGEEDQGLRVSEEQRLIEADELYRDVDINQGRGLHVSQDIEDSHVTLTLVKLDGQQESSSVSSFVTSMLNPISDAGVESIFTTASSLIAPLQTPTPIMTPSTIATITTSSYAPIPSTTIPSAEGPSAGSDRGSKRRREGGEPESASTPSEPTTRSASMSTTGTQSRQMSASESAFAEEPVQTTYTPIDFSNFIMNRLGVDTLTHELLAGPTYEL
nr:hypothetical protein [Tanacetum cinerariifolium]